MVNVWIHTDHTAFASQHTLCSTSETGPVLPSEPTQAEVRNLYKDPAKFVPRTLRKLTEVPVSGTCYFMNLNSQMQALFSAVSEER